MGRLRRVAESTVQSWNFCLDLVRERGVLRCWSGVDGG
jgi:hypothetical protein